MPEPKQIEMKFLGADLSATSRHHRDVAHEACDDRLAASISHPTLTGNSIAICAGAARDFDLRTRNRFVRRRGHKRKSPPCERAFVKFLIS
jgi:hypothetical protein